MDIKQKILDALIQEFPEADIRLEDHDGISGFIASRAFEGMSTLDRQGQIDVALSKAPLNSEERRQVLLVAGLTPAERDASGVRIRVHRIKEGSNGAFEVLVHGDFSDAEYVSDTLNHGAEIQTTEPQEIDGARGSLMSFEAKGNDANPLTKDIAVRILTSDPYIEVMPNA